MMCYTNTCSLYFSFVLQDLLLLLLWSRTVRSLYVNMPERNGRVILLMQKFNIILNCTSYITVLTAVLRCLFVLSSPVHRLGLVCK